MVLANPKKIYGVHTVILAGKSPNIRSYTVYTYGSGQPYIPLPNFPRDIVPYGILNICQQSRSFKPIAHSSGHHFTPLTGSKYKEWSTLLKTSTHLLRVSGRLHIPADPFCVQKLEEITGTKWYKLSTLTFSMFLVNSTYQQTPSVFKKPRKTLNWKDKSFLLSPSPCPKLAPHTSSPLPCSKNRGKHWIGTIKAFYSHLLHVPSWLRIPAVPFRVKKNEENTESER